MTFKKIGILLLIGMVTLAGCSNASGLTGDAITKNNKDQNNNYNYYNNEYPHIYCHSLYAFHTYRFSPRLGRPVEILCGLPMMTRLRHHTT